jgi:hypothetical protein
VNDCFTSDSCQPGLLQLVAQVPADAAPGGARMTVSDGITQASVTFMVITPVTPKPTIKPSIVLRPASGPAGTWITLSGAGFAKNVQLVLKWDTEIKPTQQLVIRTDAQGSFSGLLFQVPPDTKAGPHTVTVLDGAAHATADAPAGSASAIFRVTSESAPTDPNPPKPPTPPTPQPTNCSSIPSYARPPECKQGGGPLPPNPNPNPSPKPAPSPQPVYCSGIPSYAQPPECKQGSAPSPGLAPDKPPSITNPQPPARCANIPSYAQPPECKVNR